MYRLLATDIDDTILAPDGSLPPANHRALEELHRSGVTVVFSSGRATSSLRGVASRIVTPADDEYLISFNGARVTSALSDHVLSERLLPADLIAEIAEYARSHALLLHGYGGDAFVAQHSSGDHAALSEQYSLAADMEWSVAESLPERLKGGSAKLLIIGDPEKLLDHRRNLLAMSDGRYEVTFSKPTYLEIVMTGVSKGSALHVLSAHLGIPISQTVAVGDSLNDREMIRAAGVGVAVANARDELKVEADVVLNRTAAEGAIAELAERFFC